MAFDNDEAIERMYYMERQRRRSLYTQLSIPLAALTVIGGALFFLVQNFTYAPWGSIPTITFLTLSGLGIASGASTALYVHLSLAKGDYPSRSYGYLFLRLRMQGRPESAIRDEITGDMAADTEKTRRLNDTREARLYVAYRLLGFLALFTALAAIPFLWRTFREVAK